MAKTAAQGRSHGTKMNAGDSGERVQWEEKETEIETETIGETEVVVEIEKEMGTKMENGKQKEKEKGIETETERGQDKGQGTTQRGGRNTEEAGEKSRKGIETDSETEGEVGVQGRGSVTQSEGGKSREMVQGERQRRDCREWSAANGSNLILQSILMFLILWPGDFTNDSATTLPPLQTDEPAPGQEVQQFVPPTRESIIAERAKAVPKKRVVPLIEVIANDRLGGKVRVKCRYMHRGDKFSF